jgi:hypothetical protein
VLGPSILTQLGLWEMSAFAPLSGAQRTSTRALALPPPPNLTLHKFCIDNGSPARVVVMASEIANAMTATGLPSHADVAYAAGMTKNQYRAAIKKLGLSQPRAPGSASRSARRRTVRSA